MALRDGSMSDAKLVPWESSTPTGWVPRRSVRITYATHQPLRHQMRMRISRRDHAPAPIRACRGEHCSSAERSPKYGTRRCKFVPGWVCEFASACCIFFAFTADGQWPPLHTDTHPSGGRCSYGCTYVRNFSETPIRFFLRLSAILQSSGIPCKSPNKTRKPKYSEPRVIQKG